MHPQVMQKDPGKCPICQMELIAVKKGSQEAIDVITLSDQQIQLGNIKVDTIGKGNIRNQTILTGTLNIDETKSTSISARVAGRIETLYFKSQGDFVRKGDRLYDLYSEELNNAKQEYILLLEKKSSLDNTVVDYSQLIQSAENKLRLWGLAESQIKDLEKDKKVSTLTTVYSSVGGYVSSIEIRQGDYVAEGGLIFRLANLSSLWAEAQVYSSEISDIQSNGEAIVQIPDLAGKQIKGSLEFVNPEINPATRINLIRISIPNINNQLKPGMPVYVIIKNPQHNSLTLPSDAVIRNEKHSIVWIQTGHNTFKSVVVRTGQESNDRIEISSGLKEGDIIVTSGAYLLNSEYIFKHGANPMSSHNMSTMKM